MIVVIADDLTGAAEIGGIGLRYHMKVGVFMKLKEPIDSSLDLLVIAMDSRSKKWKEAEVEVSTVMKRLKSLNLKSVFVYKKVDSVLRGHVIEELKVQMKIFGRESALLVPANPHLGRIIRDGIYYIGKKKLQETHFKKDPEFLTTSSDVRTLLGGQETHQLSLASPGATLPHNKIVIGNAATMEDLREWTHYAQEERLLAGASGFFTALLEEKVDVFQKRTHTTSFSLTGKKKLMVCGSAFSKSKSFVANAIRLGKTVSLIPKYLTIKGRESSYGLQNWSKEIMSLLSCNDFVMISADPSVTYNEKGQSEILRTNMSQTVKEVLNERAVDELMIEGGATASAILNELGIVSLYPDQELSDGVIRMSVPSIPRMHITLKPGSYDWPTAIKLNEL